jgi:hypothetical protein
LEIHQAPNNQITTEKYCAYRMDFKACNFGFQLRHNLIPFIKTHKNSNKQSVRQVRFQGEVIDHKTKTKECLKMSETD